MSSTSAHLLGQDEDPGLSSTDTHVSDDRSSPVQSDNADTDAEAFVQAQANNSDVTADVSNSMTFEQSISADSGYQTLPQKPAQSSHDGNIEHDSADAFLAAANLSEEEAPQAVHGWGTSASTHQPRSGRISPQPSTEGPSSISQSGEDHTAVDTIEVSKHSASHGTASPDEEVQVDEIRSTRREISDNVDGNIPASAAVIDLTMDDDDDDEEEFNYSPIGNTRPVSHIKSEPEDEMPILRITEQIKTHAPCTTAFHGLPELGSTIIPEEADAQLRNEQPDLATDLTPAQMASMLEQFGQNNIRIETPEAEPDSDEEDIRARVTFERIKDGYEYRKETCGVSLTERIEFERASNREDSRLRARKNRKQHEYDDLRRAMQDDSLFVPEHQDLTSTAAGSADVHSDPIKEYAQVARSPTPVHDSDVEVPAKSSKRDRPKGKKAKPVEGKTAGKTRVTKKQQGSTMGAKCGRKPKEPVVNTNRLLHHDIIAEASANQGQAAQPTFTTRVKKNALAQLISSIPAEERNLYAGDTADLKKASMNFNGRGALKVNGNGGWDVRGMKSSLEHYQMLGVAWMRKREQEGKHPRGGILGDDMGFGKTVSALANIVDGRPPSTHSGPSATLVIVPPSLLDQWFSEVEKHTRIFNRVIVYRSKLMKKILDPISHLAEQDIVITSYNDVVRSLPNNNPPPTIHTPRARAEWWANEVAQHKGPLHHVKWWRIVLDEAQAIKNHLSKTSEAVCLLDGRFRWCLSGTPIQNSLEEFYPFFRFLKCDNTGSYELFKRNFCKRNSDKAIQRLQVYLGKIMLRRTHADKLFGRPILVLPPIKPVETIIVSFNAVERAIYHIIKHRFVTKVKAFSKEGNPDNKYQQIFVLLLRLRQLVGHPLLIQKTLKELLETEDLERLWSLTKGDKNLLNNDNTSQQDNMKTAEALKVALKLPLGFPGTGRTPPSDNKLSIEFRKYLESLRQDGSWGKANARSLCTSCSCPPNDPYITSCLHLYCYSCLNDLHFSEFLQKKNAATCLCCGATINKNEAQPATAFDQAGYRRNGANDRQSPDEDIDWYTVRGPILRSAKIKGAVEKIKYWFEQDPTNKILVFTQFRGMIKVMEKVCREEKDWGYASYHGAMSFEYRHEQVRRFSENEDCRILLAAMKAGGVGLNLTAANRVIILDLWWNTSVENQAFTRCFRIGQKRDVEVARFVVHNSIDTDIQRMQERKIAEIEQAMEDKNRPRLTTKELLELFCDTSERKKMEENDEQQMQVDAGEDEPFIFPDDPYDQPDDDDDDVAMADAE